MEPAPDGAVVDAPAAVVAAPEPEPSSPPAPAPAPDGPAPDASAEERTEPPSEPPAPVPLTREEKARLLAQLDPDDLKDHPEFQRHVRRAQARTQETVRKEMAQAAEYNAQMATVDSQWRSVEESGQLHTYLNASQQNRDGYMAVQAWREAQRNGTGPNSVQFAAALVQNVKTRIAANEKLAAVSEDFDALAEEHADPAEWIHAMIERGVERRTKELEKWAESEVEARTTERLAKLGVDKAEPESGSRSKGPVNSFQPKSLQEVYEAVGNGTITAAEGNRLQREFQRLAFAR
jgi:hypothetical protein